MSRAKRQYYAISQTEFASFADSTVRTPVSVEVLLDILRRPRFADSEGEQYVIDKYLMALEGAAQDGYGNIALRIRRPDGELPTTMFSAHTDTVHKAKATDTYKLSIKKTWLSTAGGGVLGADCGTGIWIMLNLIKAQVPGLYVFHREEEIGGGGSQHFAKNQTEVLKGIQRCIAFDRKDISHVITHQGGSRCCSDTFADALADALNQDTGFTFHGDDTGSFTDSANYTHLIPECTNLSVGYYDQHTQHECQDLSFATRLVERMLQIDFEALPTERDPEAEDEDDFWGDSVLNDYFTRRYGSDYNDDLGATDLPPKTPHRRAVRHSFEKMAEIVQTFPHEVADMLEQLGYDTENLLVELETTYGEDVSAYLGA
jgi:hypothetical protein